MGVLPRGALGGEGFGDGATGGAIGARARCPTIGKSIPSSGGAAGGAGGLGRCCAGARRDDTAGKAESSGEEGGTAQGSKPGNPIAGVPTPNIVRFVAFDRSDGGGGGALPGTFGSVVAVSFFTTNVVPHFGHRILSPLGGTRRSSTR